MSVVIKFADAVAYERAQPVDSFMVISGCIPRPSWMASRFAKAASPSRARLWVQDDTGKTLISSYQDWVDYCESYED